MLNTNYVFDFSTTHTFFLKKNEKIENILFNPNKIIIFEITKNDGMILATT